MLEHCGEKNKGEGCLEYPFIKNPLNRKFDPFKI